MALEEEYKPVKTPKQRQQSLHLAQKLKAAADYANSDSDKSSEEAAAKSNPRVTAVCNVIYNQLNGWAEKGVMAEDELIRKLNNAVLRLTSSTSKSDVVKKR